jgi:hypothetical protein
MRLDLKSLLLIAMLTGCSSQPDPPDNAQSGIATPVESPTPEPSVAPTLSEPDNSVTPIDTIDEVRNSADGECRKIRLPGNYERGTGPLSGRWVEGPLVCDPAEARPIIAPARAVEPIPVVPARPAPIAAPDSGQ